MVAATDTNGTKGKRVKQEFITPKIKQDAFFILISFVIMVILIFHYAWIMKQLLSREDMNKVKTAQLFLLFFVNAYVIMYILLNIVYPRVYKDSLSKRKGS
ncbi:Piso0_005694 [Millerozyma farinosa CBS 7064]|uniref:Piso0_005694 protein n=1 Tax=Pichia sorbitophila (strain ATCC MYA-4447 / BCRC 22081 / CBS 7064 / NBRC 10061 / NRRL Y-12695) TaxID=559304 RepID=G8Y2N6_PICSO|nr:Piso0_005694 [Millerozyma farinosa CBS 7064]